MDLKYFYQSLGFLLLSSILDWKVFYQVFFQSPSKKNNFYTQQSFYLKKMVIVII